MDRAPGSGPALTHDALAYWSGELGRWAAGYLESLRERPVRAQSEPGAILRQIPAAPPEEATDFEALFRDFQDIVLPGITHWQHPRFFAYFAANSSPPSVLAEFLTSVLAAQCMLWQTSPAATELETAMIDWLRGMIGLPEAFRGVIQDSASSATLAAILTARERALGWEGNAKGLAGGPVCRIYATAEAHSSIDKSCWIAGIGQENLIKVETAGARRGMRVDALQAAIRADRATGLRPAGIVASLGGTSTGACDDIAAVAEVARAEGLYLHVDAAWAGSAMICPEFRDLMAGAELADSFVFNPHKWLFTNFDCSAHFVRDPASLVRTLAIHPTYLETQGQADIVNYSEWSVPLGRRFRALKLWFVIRSYGVRRMQELIRQHVAWAEALAKRLEAEPDFEIVTQPLLSLFTFRYRPSDPQASDRVNAALLQAINDDGRIYLTPTKVEGRYVLRFQVGQTHSSAADVDLAFQVVTDLARALD
ncbi:MAG: aspartate aminotransferase family protein [Rhodospirillales bacterium]